MTAYERHAYEIVSAGIGLVQPFATYRPSQDQLKSSWPVLEGSEELENDLAAPPTSLILPQNLQKPLDVFYVKAIHDYSNDNSTALPFHKGDIIQVLGTLKSGWSDGVINDVRGWFPSNYCRLQGLLSLNGWCGVRIKDRS